MLKSQMEQNNASVEMIRGGGTRRNTTIDIIKAIAAFFVVLIHFPFPGIVGETARVLADFAVPFFFMCSGYYCFPACGGTKMRKKTFHIVKLALLGVMIYGMYDVITAGFSTVISKITILNIGKWILFNVPFIGCYHLWFLYALIYTYLVWMLIRRTRLVKYSLPLAATILCIRFAIYDLLPFFTDKEILPISLGRSAWLIGIPFFLIGYAIHNHQSTVEKLNLWIVMLLTILGAAISAFTKLSPGAWMLAIGLFLFAVAKPNLPSFWLSEIGKEHSMLIYMLHPLIGDIFLNLGFFDQEIWRWFMPLAVTFTSVLLSIFVSCVTKNVHLSLKER